LTIQFLKKGETKERSSVDIRSLDMDKLMGKKAAHTCHTGLMKIIMKK